MPPEACLVHSEGLSAGRWMDGWLSLVISLIRAPLVLQSTHPLSSGGNERDGVPYSPILGEDTRPGPGLVSYPTIV